MRFSERMGLKPPKMMQVDSLDEETRILLWDITREAFESDDPNFDGWDLVRSFHFDFQKRSRDDFEFTLLDFLYELKHYIYSFDFYDVFDILEFVCDKMYDYAEKYNIAFTKEKVAYRFVGGQIVPISDPVELASIEASLDLPDPFSGARTHIAAGLNAFSLRPKGDYRNAVREVISAVESVAKVVAGDNKADLGAALKAVDKAHGLHPAFKDAMIKLYAYTNDEKGIRHALLDETAQVDEADAHFMIVACAAFVNFLVQKFGDRGAGGA